MNSTIKIIPTEAAINTAIRNAAKMADQGYTLEQSRVLLHLWSVMLPNAPKTFYTVDTLRERCECPQYRHEGVCKHQKFVADEIRLQEMEEDHAAALCVDLIGNDVPRLPICPIHGEYEDNLSFCERCESAL